MELISLLAMTAFGLNNKMATNFAVPEMNRVAMTPLLDGRLDDEEWDALSETSELKSYFQWEPGALYLAGAAAATKDIIFSIDADGDGWLVGRNNVEVRLSLVDGDVKPSIRILDTTRPQEPIWVACPWLEQTVTAHAITAGGDWTAEVKILPIDLPAVRSGMSLGIRADAVEKSETFDTTDLIRRVTPVSLRFERSRGLPNGMEWQSQAISRSVTPSENFKIRMNFRRPKDTELDRIYCRTLGLGRPSTTAFEMPFPDFDRKGRAFVDYSTKVAKTATHGYRVLEAKIRGQQGEDITIQTSFSVRPSVELEAVVGKEVTMRTDAQDIPVQLTVRSFSDSRIRGSVVLHLPDNWTMRRGDTHKVAIYQSHGIQRIPVTVTAPPEFQGLATLTADLTVGDEVVSVPVYVLVR